MSKKYPLPKYLRFMNGILGEGEASEGFGGMSPDLCIEIISDSESRADMFEGRNSLRSGVNPP